MDPEDVRAYLNRDRAAVEALRIQHWREQYAARGPLWALQLAGDLRRWYQTLHPGWPTEADREADLAMHMRVSAALGSVAPRDGA